jgi:PLP dependent protein
VTTQDQELLTVGRRLAQVKEAVARTAEHVGRDPSEITIVAVSKEKSAEEIREAVRAGQLDFGENRAQEAASKSEALSEESLRWHFVGRLQRNKVKLINDFVHMIHSVDRLELGEEISRRSSEDR